MLFKYSCYFVQQPASRESFQALEPPETEFHSLRVPFLKPGSSLDTSQLLTQYQFSGRGSGSPKGTRKTRLMKAWVTPLSHLCFLPSR